MNVFVLVPSDDYKASAGARIRYGRLSDELAARDIELTMRSIGEFDPLTADCDAAIISKCHDARSVIAAAVLANSGKAVGVDLFDDYFSDSRDSRLSRYRGWLSQIIDICDFALCSTEAMTRVVHQYRPGLATHQLNDPAPAQDLAELSSLIDRKLARARDERRVRVAWFGVGDNPYFPVGLADLAAHAIALRELGRAGFSVDLTVLTNRRSLTGRGLSLLAQLAVPVQVRDWSGQAERELLDEAQVVFLPVSAQNFSAAKSLNRALTGLAHGCQILSAGYPLYAPLENLIYRDARELVSDLARASVRFSAATMAEYRDKLESHASAAREAEALTNFLGGVSVRTRAEPGPLRLVHGHASSVGAHKLAHSVSALSVASPYCSAAFEFDVVFRGGRGRLEMLVTRQAAERLLPHLQRRLKKEGGYYQIDQGRGGLDDAARRKDWSKEPLAFQLAGYDSTMKEIEQRLAESFGPGRTIFSEVSRLPFPSLARWPAAA